MRLITTALTIAPQTAADAILIIATRILTIVKINLSYPPWRICPLVRFARTLGLDWSPEKREHERLKQREGLRLYRLDTMRRRAGAKGRITRIERTEQMGRNRGQDWLAMAERNARVLYEQALLRSANPTHALMGDTPPG